MDSTTLKKAQSLSKHLSNLGYSPRPVKQVITVPTRDESAVARMAAQTASNAAETASNAATEMARIASELLFKVKSIEVLVATIKRDQKLLSKDEILSLIESRIAQSEKEEEATEPTEIDVTDDMVKRIVQIMHRLPETDKLEVSKGIRNSQSFIFGRTKYQVSELMHGGGGSGSGTSSGFQQPTAGTVDGVNTDFTFALAPNAISVDGVVIEAVSNDGTVNWTGTTSITLTIAPNFAIFAVA